MVNLEHRNNQMLFHVNGNDMRTSHVAILFPMLLVLFTVALHYWVLGGLFVEMKWPLISFEIFINVLLTLLFYRKLSTGTSSRYVIDINISEAQIQAKDKTNNQILWVDKFTSSKVFLSEIQVWVGKEQYIYPALVYGDERKEIVEESVPYPELSILGYGEESELTKVLSLLQN